MQQSTDRMHPQQKHTGIIKVPVMDVVQVSQAS
jgi:hypothetical protein